MRRHQPWELSKPFEPMRTLKCADGLHQSCLGHLGPWVLYHGENKLLISCSCSCHKVGP